MIAHLKAVGARYFEVSLFSRLATWARRAFLAAACLGLLALPARGQTGGALVYTFTNFAGTAPYGSADGVGTAQFNNPNGIAVDTNGNVYVADTSNDTIRKVTQAGVVTTIAGLAGSAGTNDGLGSVARFSQPGGLAIDAGGSLYVADFGNGTIRKMTLAGANWIVSTIVGTPGTFGTNDGMGGAAQIGSFNSLQTFMKPPPFQLLQMGAFDGLAVDAATNLYLADTFNCTIRVISPVGTNWVVTTIAGGAPNAGPPGGGGGGFGPTEGYNYTNGPGNLARFYFPAGLTVDQSGNLYVADTGNNSIREITPPGRFNPGPPPMVSTEWVVSNVAGSPQFDDSGNIVFQGSQSGTGTDARFDLPIGMAADSTGNILYVTESDAATVRKLVFNLFGQGEWTVEPYVGTTFGRGPADGLGANAQFNNPHGLTIDGSGNLYVADTGNNKIREITPSQVVTSLAGIAASPANVDGAGSAARFQTPEALTVDKNGSVFVADTFNETIRKITSAGVVSTIAGRAGTVGTNNGAGTNAQFFVPLGIAVDSGDNVYVADEANEEIRKVSAAGTTSLVAGLFQLSMSSGQPISGTNDGVGTAAQFNGPKGIAVDNATNLYVADGNNNEIRKITPGGLVTTIAGVAQTDGSGNPAGGYADGTNRAALFNFELSETVGMAVDGATNIYITESGNQVIRKMTPVGANWVVSTIAGLAGAQGTNDGTGTNAQFFNPSSITVDSATNLFVEDTFNLRKITPQGTNWVVTTIPGGLAAGVGVDAAGDLFLANAANNTILRGTFTAFGAANPAAYTPPVMTGSLSVTLLPPEANGQWRLPWEQIWHNSGEVVSNLAKDNYTVEFRVVPGYLTIDTNFIVGVTNGGTTFVTNQYLPTIAGGAGGTGSLTVNITPGSLGGIGWRFIGESGWRAAGSTVANLLPDFYFIEYAPVSGRAKPGSEAVQVTAGSATVIAANYLVSGSAPPGVLLPVAVPTNEISDVADFPFGFNGQLQSDTGFASGAAVQATVVLTAAHVVFNDETMSYVSQVYWYFQRETGLFAPEPVAARGWYVQGGYAAQRTHDLANGFSPDQSSAQSRNVDAAALYFLNPMAGGSFGGFLPSDVSPNPWLTGNNLKMVTGYPVDGSIFGDASIVPGTMYQTMPSPNGLSLATDTVTNQQEVYTAPWFFSYPGNSGGPVYVQQNGYYYPAGIYLGTLFSGSLPSASLVLGINSAVVNLITNAALLGDSGASNNTGGGVVTVIPSLNISAVNPGYMQWHLGPAAAVAAGAAWRLQGDASFSTSSNYTRAVTSTNAVMVEFKAIAGWNLPVNQAVNVQSGQVTSYGANYTVASPMLKLSAQGLGLVGTTNTMYRIEKNTSLKGGTWMGISTNVIVTGGFNLVVASPGTNAAAVFYRAVWLGN